MNLIADLQYLLDNRGSSRAVMAAVKRRMLCETLYTSDGRKLSIPHSGTTVKRAVRYLFNSGSRDNQFSMLVGRREFEIVGTSLVRVASVPPGLKEGSLFLLMADSGRKVDPFTLWPGKIYAIIPVTNSSGAGKGSLIIEHCKRGSGTDDYTVHLNSFFAKKEVGSLV